MAKHRGEYNWERHWDLVIEQTLYWITKNADGAVQHVLDFVDGFVTFLLRNDDE